MCFKGNVGRPGPPGPTGPTGEGIQGPKVNVTTVLHIESAAVSFGAYMLHCQQLPDKLAAGKTTIIHGIPRIKNCLVSFSST